MALFRKHKHVIVRAYVNNPPSDEKLLEEWCRDVIHQVGMNVLDGPHVVYSKDVPGNEGYTATAVLDFSHMALHAWDCNGLLEFDLFSCKDFDIGVVLTKLDEFDIITYSTLVLDRDEFDDEMIPFIRTKAA